MEPNVNQNPNPQPEQPQGQYQSYQQPQPGYQQQAYYAPNPAYQPYQPASQSKVSGMAIASMVLGICSILFSAGAITGLVCAILALVFAGKMSKQAPDGNLGASKNFVLAGKICGIVGLVFSILFLIFWILFTILTVVLIQQAAPYLNDFTPYINGNIDIHLNATSFLF